MLPWAVARLSCCCTWVVSRLKTRLKSMVPVRYWPTPTSVAALAAVTLRARSSACSRDFRNPRRGTCTSRPAESTLVLVSGDHFLQPRLLQTHVVEDSAVVQDVPAEAGNEKAQNALVRERLREVFGIPADGAVDEDGGIKVGFGDADLSRLRSDLALGAANVGTAAQQVGRDAGGDPGGRVRNRRAAQRRPRPQIGREVSRRGAHQGAERIIGLAEHDLECGDRGAGLLEYGPRLLDVEPGRRADAEFLGRECKHTFLNPDVVLRDLDPLLGDPVLHVIRGDVGEEGHERGVVVFH